MPAERDASDATVPGAAWIVGIFLGIDIAGREAPAPAGLWRSHAHPLEVDKTGGSAIGVGSYTLTVG